MKCIKNLRTGEITKVDDVTADEMVLNKNLYWFAPKSEWKEKVRDAVKAVVKTDEEISKHKKTKQRRAEKHAKIAERQNRI